MSLPQTKGIFITATGTDVGKTYVTALIVKKMVDGGQSAGYFKPALSGAELCYGELVPGDSRYVVETAGLQVNPLDLVSYVYETAVSPHLAAQLECKPIELDVIAADFERLKQQAHYITVEGCGGIICPLRLDDQVIMLTDVIKRLQLGIVIVALAELGTINHVMLTAEYARRQGIEVRGIILNRYDSSKFLHRDNKQTIERLTGIPVVACVADHAQQLDIDISTLCQLYKEC